MMYPQSSINIASKINGKINSHLVLEKSVTDNSRWIVITGHSATDLILNTLGDKDKKKIMTSVFDNPFIIQEILRSCKIPQTSGYRKINSLIRDGLLIKQGHVTIDGKKVDKYKSLFKEFVIDIEKNSVFIKAKVSCGPWKIFLRFGYSVSNSVSNSAIISGLFYRCCKLCNYFASNSVWHDFILWLYCLKIFMETIKNEQIDCMVKRPK